MIAFGIVPSVLGIIIVEAVIRPTIKWTDKELDLPNNL